MKVEFVLYGTITRDIKRVIVEAPTLIDALHKVEKQHPRHRVKFVVHAGNHGEAIEASEAGNEQATGRNT